jgi:hypothetical protein
MRVRVGEIELAAGRQLASRCTATSDPATFSDMMRRESEKWKKVIDAANIKVE